MSDRQIVFLLVADSLGENLRQHLAEQSGNHKGQEYDQYGRSQIEKQPHKGYEDNPEAIVSHSVETAHILETEAVVVQHRAEYFPELPDDQHAEDAGQKEQQCQLPAVFRKIRIISAIETDGKGQRPGNHNSGVKHEIQHVFGE